MVTHQEIQSADDMLRVYPAYLFGTPQGIGILVLSIVTAVLALFVRSIKWVFIAVIVYVTSLGIATDGAGTIVLNPLLQPFSSLRALNRPIAALLLMLLSLTALMTGTGVRSRLLSGAMLWFFLFQIYTCAAQVQGGEASRAITTLFLYGLIYFAFGYGLPRWLQGPDAAYALLRAVLGASALLIFGIACHLAFSRSAMFVQGRLTGTTGNPQFLGAFLVFFLPCCYGLLLRRGEPMPVRVVSACCIMFSIVGILATGSRTAVLAGIVGGAIFFRRRLGQLALTGLAGAAALLVTLQLLGSSVGVSNHIFYTTNTRLGVWAGMLGEFFSHPVLGAGASDHGPENSYLSVLAMYGLAGGIPFGMAVWLMVRDSVRVVRQRRYLGRHAVLADVVVAMLAEILVASLFDAHLLATVSCQIFLIYICMTLHTLLLDRAVFGGQAVAGPGPLPEGAWHAEAIDGPFDSRMNGDAHEAYESFAGPRF